MSRPGERILFFWDKVFILSKEVSESLLLKHTDTHLKHQRPVLQNQCQGYWQVIRERIRQQEIVSQRCKHHKEMICDGYVTIRDNMF